MRRQGIGMAMASPAGSRLTNGTITVRRPRVRDLNERFVSRVLPLFKRQTKEVGELLPQLYLHGLALGDFELALRGLLGDGAPLSPASLLRLKAQWQEEYETWKQRRLDDLEVVYLWADGLYVKAGLEDTKSGTAGDDRSAHQRPESRPSGRERAARVQGVVGDDVA